MDDFIPLEKCKHGTLYYVWARNFRLGIFDAPTRGFIGIRLKFASRFLFEEDHWDVGAPFGTVKPVKELEKTPFDVLICDSREKLALDIFVWLEKKDLVYEEADYPCVAPGHD